ncbi:unnamed protein product [Chironomus riparius]|uniref:Uncharacterized protein n=1 Tax=Chironomus riparius TaxID=315576 RepID=A0A9N9RXE7_9DIPT|nr:unnamed protein product [Chironomus riparius]
MSSIACRCRHPIFSGSGLGDIRLYKSSPRLQYGANIRLVEGRNLGGAFTRFFRYIAPIVQKALPFIKSGAKAAGKEVLQGGLEILENINDKPLKDLMKEQTKKRVQNLSEKAAQTLKKNLSEELMIFEKKPNQVAIDSSEFVKVSSVNSIENSNIVEFRDLGSARAFKALSQTLLVADIQVIKSDGKLYTSEDSKQPTLANNILASLIKSISLSLNNVNVVTISETYAQREYIEDVLNYNEETVKNKLWMQGLYPIETAAEKIKESTKNSKIIQLITTLNLCTTSKLLIPNVDIYIKLELANAAFPIIEDDTSTSKIVIKNIYLMMKYVYCKTGYNMFVERELSDKTKAVYDFKSSLILNYTLPNNTTEFSIPSIYTGAKPSFVLIAFVKTSSFLGDNKEDPHKYQIFDMNKFNFILNGQLHPKTPFVFKNDETEQKIAKLYMNLQHSIGMDCNNESNLVTQKNFTTNNFFISLDLSSFNFALSDINEATENVNLGFSVVFSKPTPHPITALLYILRPRCFEISPARVVDVIY